MKRFLIGLLVLVMLVAPFFVVAQGRVCDPFTTIPDAGMLPLGQVVEFQHWEGAPQSVTRTGKIEAYYIQSCFPKGGSIIGLDAQAYVVNYGSADGTRVILNRGAISIPNNGG